MDVYNITGDAAKRISNIEQEMKMLTDTMEKQLMLYSEQIKDIIYESAGLSKSEGDKRHWSLVAKYYPKLGFYIAECDDLLFSSFDLPEPETKPTIQ